MVTAINGHIIDRRRGRQETRQASGRVRGQVHESRKSRKRTWVEAVQLGENETSTINHHGDCGRFLKKSEGMSPLLEEEKETEEQPLIAG
jgi:hypothetical protein